VRKLLSTHTLCTVNDNSNPQCFALFFFFFLLWFFFQIFYCWFHLLILEWLMIWLHNLFIFILPLPFYKVSMVYRFPMVTQVALVYEFDEVFLKKNWTWIFYHLFFSHVVKKLFSEKSYVIKLYKVYDLFTCFVGWLNLEV